MGKKIGLNTLTTGHAGRFPSGWGWFCSFPPPLGVYTQLNNEKTHINIRPLVLLRPYSFSSSSIEVSFGVQHVRRLSQLPA
jgi:hypothetical protein